MRLVLRCRGAVVALALAVGAVACGSSPSGTQTDARPDGTGAVALDAARDVTPDLPADVAPPDAPAPDAPAPDAPADLPPPDAPVPPDAPADLPPPDAPVPPDAPPDTPPPPDAGADADADAAAPNPFAGHRWAALPVPLGTPLSAIAIDSEGALYVGAGGDTFFSGSPQAGMFKSTDDGSSWRAVNRGVYDFHVGALATVGTTVYAGTAGLLRSDDRGATWAQMTYADSTSVVTGIGAQGDLVVFVVGSFANRCYLSTDGGRTFPATPVSCESGSGAVTSLDVVAAGTVIVRAGDRGVVRSTDRGATFNPVAGIVNGDGLGARVRCDGGSTCYAVAHTTSRSLDPAVLLKSTDAGATFTPLAPPGAVGSVLAISDSGSVYVWSSYMIARSDDGGATWELVHRPTTTGAFEPNCNGPFVARGDKLFAACVNGVYRSYDKGRHWQPASGTTATGAITGGPAYQMFVDTTATALGATGDIYVVASGPPGPPQLQRSSDGGWTWQTLARPFKPNACIVTGGGALECTGASDAIPPTQVIARSDDHGATWRNLPVPAGTTTSGAFGIATFARGAGAVVYAAGNGVARSSDDGLTFQYLTGSPNVARVQVLRSGHLVALDTNGLGATYRSTDQGATWQPSERIYNMPVVEDAAGRLIRYTGASNFEVSTDEGATWRTQSSQGLPLVIGLNLPMAIDGAGNLFVFGPGPPAAGSGFFGSAWQVVASADGGARFLPMPDQIPNPNATTFATDKQGRLIVATTGGVFRLDADTNPGPPRPGDGGPPDGGAGGPAPRPLTMVLENAPWTTTVSHPGFAVDASHRLYRMDTSTIYAVDGATVSPHLTLAEVVTSAGLMSGFNFEDIDMGPDGQLYAMLRATPMGGSNTDLIVQSSAAHQAASWRVLPTVSAAAMNVMGAGRVGVIDWNGLSTFTAGSAQMVYTRSQLQSTDNNCATQDLAIGASGVFVYLPGCLASGLLRGNADGSGVGVLYATGYSAADAGGFGCAARDPAGGFYVVALGDGVGRTDGSPRLYHIAESGSGATSLAPVATEPSLGEARLARGGPSAGQFGRCSMAVAANGVIYLQTLKEVWKIGL